MKFYSLSAICLITASLVSPGYTHALTQDDSSVKKTGTALAKTTVYPIKKTSFSPAKPVKKPLKIAVQKKSPPTPLTDSEIKKIIKNEIEQLIIDGKLATTTAQSISFEKLQTVNRSYNEETPGFQPYYAPAAVIANVGTFFSASNVGAENLNGTNLTSDSATLNSLTVSEKTTLEGGLALTTPEQGNVIDSDSGAYLSSGGTWTNTSSRDLKENFAELDHEEILKKINTLSITRWNYKKESASTTHIGPMAEEFYEAFSTGGQAGQTSISTIDPSGVALAGIQALSKKFTNLEWLQEAAKKIGIIIEEGLIRVKSLIVASLQTNSLEIGSSETANGITMYDSATKQPVCVMVTNGSIHIDQHKCSANPVEPIEDQANIPQLQPEEKKAVELPSPDTVSSPADTVQLSTQPVEQAAVEVELKNDNITANSNEGNGLSTEPALD